MAATTRGSEEGAARLLGTVSTTTTVAGAAQEVWNQIVDVDIAAYAQPAFFKVVGIPHPLRAEVRSQGIGGERIAYFDTGKRFLQRITEWEPLRRYAFTFNPEPGFKVLYVFDLSDGPVQIPSGSYDLEPAPPGTLLRLSTQYSIDRRAGWLLLLPVRGMLGLFQRYLLRSIAANLARTGAASARAAPAAPGTPA